MPGPIWSKFNCTFDKYSKTHLNGKIKCPQPFHQMSKTISSNVRCNFIKCQMQFHQMSKQFHQMSKTISSNVRWYFIKKLIAVIKCLDQFDQNLIVHLINTLQLVQIDRLQKHVFKQKLHVFQIMRDLLIFLRSWVYSKTFYIPNLLMIVIR